MKLRPQQIESVLALNAPERYSHFVKVAADQSKVWGLFCEGWALAATNDNVEAFPIWPAEEYAQLCVSGSWSNYLPREIEIHDLIDRLLPKLQASKTEIAIFPTPQDKGVMPSISLLVEDLRHELSRIE